jgi:hypothetical protein
MSIESRGKLRALCVDGRHSGEIPILNTAWAAPLAELNPIA